MWLAVLACEHEVLVFVGSRFGGKLFCGLLDVNLSDSLMRRSRKRNDPYSLNLDGNAGRAALWQATLSKC